MQPQSQPQFDHSNAPPVERDDVLRAEGDGDPKQYVYADPEEAAVITRVQRGDQAAFDTLARRYSARAFAVAFRVLRNRQDAEDLVQDAFLVALNKIATFDATRPFAPWFLRIVFTRGLNERKSRAARERRVQAVDSSELESKSSGPGAAADADTYRHEIRHRFHEALQGLSERRRLIVQLADVDGMTGDEIADNVSLPSGTVRWHLHEARRALRQALADLNPVQQGRAG
ncbi:MAG: sigma-70 family RNA polymerase sigma factor [Gemmatimonadota bacterium]|nr:sigma-70 family RNA polymerase sigma factor [Gemmatimonadota bacterium]